jgi:hypothetical protein
MYCSALSGDKLLKQDGKGSQMTGKAHFKKKIRAV